jgi:putative oxidoreductase
VSGIVQRLFPTFADGWPGGGLLLQRLLAGGALVYHGLACFSETPICASFVTQGIGVLAGVLLIAGLWTPIAGVVVAVVEARIAFTSDANASISIVLAILGATLAMIGPGTWSVDGLMFGRKHIVTPDL